MLAIKKQNLAKATADAEKLCTMMLKISDSNVLMRRFAETNERIKALSEEISVLEQKNRMLPQAKEIKMWLNALLDKSIKSQSVRNLISACIARVYVDNDDKGIIIWQLGNREVDDDTISAIISNNIANIEGQKENAYTADNNCIDANEPGSPDWT